MYDTIGVGYGGGRGGTCPLKFRKNIFSSNFYVKFGHFSGENHVKFRHFVNFHTYFSGKNVLPPKVDRAPTPMDDTDTALCICLCRR